MLERRAIWVIFVSIFAFQTGALRIPLGTNISVSQNQTWVSPNGDFALGFFNNSSHQNQYNVGIRFNSDSIPFSERTLVWVVGAGISVGPSSYFQLTNFGELVLFDSSKQFIVWSSNTCNLSVSSASLLDTGNFVLFSQKDEIIWESFKFPSDTLLPDQKFTSFETLRALNPNSSISSYYTLKIDPIGQLKLNWETNITYWSSNSVSPLPISSAILTKEGSFQLIDQASKPLSSLYGDDHNDSSVKLRFLRLDSDGNLRMYSFDGTHLSWRPAWRAVSNQCEVFATCGLKGLCFFNNSSSPICKCPFAPNPSSNMDSNCLAPYYSDCNSGVSMSRLEYTVLYGIYPPQDIVVQASMEECRVLCLKDLNCTAITVNRDGSGQCRIKKTRFISGYERPDLLSVSFVKICLDPVAVMPVKTKPPLNPSVTDLRKNPESFYIYMAVGSGLGAILFVLVVQVGVMFCFLKRKKVGKAKFPNCPFECSIGLVSLSYSEVKDITSEFKNQLGPGLFKGILRSNRVVVVKELTCDNTQHGPTINDKLFKLCVALLGGIHHKNLVKLEGYCCNSDQRFLVYEFHKNGSVAKWMKNAKNCKKLTWRKRLEICISVAKAISYLHSGCREYISHGDLKWENVLLDENLEPKVCNYGLTKIDGKRIQNGEIGAEIDIEKFGEIIIGLLTGRECEMQTCKWVYEKWMEGNGVEEIVDLRLKGKFEEREVERVLRVGFWCVQSDERLRPSMGEVVKVLEGTLSVDHPPPPYPGPAGEEGENCEGFDEVID
ncbi:hypothetical protein LUZ60_010538 [Juncus effusus]|nr:hypothetical protein LUZ60_010538 [Juncus effusus]